MPTRETTIADAKSLDVQELMSDDFDVETFLNSQQREQLDVVSEFLDRDDLLADMSIEQFLGQSGVIDQDITARRERLSSYYEATTSVGLWKSLSGGWNNGSLQIDISGVRRAEMRNQITPAEAQRQVDLLKGQMVNTKPSSWYASWAGSAANILPMMVGSAKAGFEAGFPTALATGAAGVALATGVGQIPPLLAIPEEAATVPIGFAGGFQFGLLWGGKIGALDYIAEIEGGLLYDELLSFVDADGNKIDPKIARPIARVLGVMQSLLELAVLDDLIKTIPGGRKLLRSAISDTMSRLARSRKLLNVAARGVTRFGGNVGFETSVEIVQEANSIAWGEFAKVLNNKLNDTTLTRINAKNITDRLVQTGIEAAKGFSLLALPGNVITTVQQVGATVSLTAPTEKVIAPPVVRISVINPSEEVRARVDLFETELGVEAVPETVTVPDAIEAPAKPPNLKKLRKQAKNLDIDVSDIKGKGAAEQIEARVQEAEAARPLPERGRAPLTPEEQLQLQQSEATLAAEEPFTIKPRLYIGNVTARMKKVFGEALGVSPERIHGFTENGFPVNRTAIDLTMGEARSYLYHLETSLQERLDNNQINTHSDMARANADWGDMKELRKKLGLPTIKRPFVIIKDAETKVITIENIRERIRKAVEPSQLDIVETTQIDRLNNVMRQIVKATKKGLALGKKEQREIFALLQQLRKQKQIRDGLIRSIKKPASKNTDVFYRKAIEGIQDSIDFKATDEAARKKKDSLRQHLDRNPENANEIPADILETLEKKDISTLTHADLLKIRAEVIRLKMLGRLKFKEVNAQRNRAKSKLISTILKNVGAATKSILPSAERALALGPPRIFDMIDGGKDFDGEAHDFFYDATNENVNVELQNTGLRHKAMQQKRKELGISLGDLSRKRQVGELLLSLDELLSIYAGWQNPASRAALIHGGFVYRFKGKETITEVTEALHTQVVEVLSDAEKIWADTIIQEYAEHYARLRNTTIRAEGRDLGREPNYTPIRHDGIEHLSADAEIVAEISERQFYRAVGVQKGFTIDRKSIPAEYMKPVKLGLTKQWSQQVRKQEHYINHAVHVRDMNSLSQSPQFRKAVEDKFGKPILAAVDHYVKSIANPDFYRTFNDMENLSRAARAHTVIAYLAFNVTTIMKQVPSILLYWSKSSIGDMIASATNATMHPRKAFNSALENHPQLSDQAIEREMAEMQTADPVGYGNITRTIGRAGLFGIMSMDAAVKTIGINAVMTKALRDGASPNAAARKAQQATLLTQPGFSPKDRAQIYSQSEFLNWFLQFTNQLNKLYNVATYDIPVAFRNKNYAEAAKSATALAVMAMLIRTITSGEVPEDPEDAVLALAEQAVSSIPIIGPPAASILKGYRPGAIPPIQAIGGAVSAGKSVFKGDVDKALEKLMEPVAVGIGLPYAGPKKIFDVVTQ